MDRGNIKEDIFLKPIFKKILEGEDISHSLEDILNYPFVNITLQEITEEYNEKDINRLKFFGVDQRSNKKILIKQKDFRERMESLNTEELNAIVKCNRLIDRLNAYGIRKQRVPSDHSLITQMSWSNGGECWFATKITIFNIISETEVQLDANEFIAPYPLEIMKNITFFLNPLPLFKLSIEAKNRGKAPKNANLIYFTLRMKHALENKETFKCCQDTFRVTDLITKDNKNTRTLHCPKCDRELKTYHA